MSELGKRTLSAVVMLAVAGLAVAVGGWPFALFVAIIGIVILFEFVLLVKGFAKTSIAQGIWIVGGAGYIITACWFLVRLRAVESGVWSVVTVLGAVIATDIGAYAAGRSIGGPKIAPRISPSKTWAGLGGAVIATAIWLMVVSAMSHSQLPVTTDGPLQDRFNSAAGWGALLFWAVGGGLTIAVVAQSGDFFESWMKRRAGVKDSGSVLPGHGGVFDRTDGLIAVLFVGAIAHWLLP